MFTAQEKSVIENRFGGKMQYVELSYSEKDLKSEGEKELSYYANVFAQNTSEEIYADNGVPAVFSLDTDLPIIYHGKVKYNTSYNYVTKKLKLSVNIDEDGGHILNKPKINSLPVMIETADTADGS